MIKPHGNNLVNRLADDNILEEIKNLELFKIEISNRTASDCEMIATGAFSPLDGFMNKENALSVIENICLKNGLVWSIPILLPINKNDFEKIEINNYIGLYHKNILIAYMQIEEKFNLDLEHYCINVFKTNDESHSGVKTILSNGNSFVSGKITLINRPLKENIDSKYFLDPIYTRKIIEEKGLKKVVAFQTRNPIHRAHEYLIKSVIEQSDCVWIHPLVGDTKSDDIPADIRMKCYEVLTDNYFNPNFYQLSVLTANMNYAGPREAIHHMIIRQNFGFTHMIVGRDHAGVGNFYGTYDAQKLVTELQDRLNIKAIKFDNTFYCKKCSNLASLKTCPHDSSEHLNLSGTKVRDMLKNGEIPPDEFTRKEVANILIEWAKNTK
ncbi:MAG: sulfate adenylyltransferase [Candidatus Sericytochromatia bacterium]